MKKESHNPSGQAIPVYQLKIVLSDLKPLIWRQVLVRGDTNLGFLHAVIQVVMGWTNSHLHQFLVGERYYSDPSSELDEDTVPGRILDENQAVLMDVAPHKGDVLWYEYDFGDSWHHGIHVEEIQTPASPRPGPVECIGGARACPPEDCGGMPGYLDLLDTLKHPKRREYAEIMEWLGGSFDPETFDLNKANRYLHKLKWPRTTVDQLARILMQRDGARE